MGRQKRSLAEAMQMSHLHDVASQKASWEAVVKVAGGIDYPVAA
jgi:hypothetical protein